jgi:transcriptional regulator with XRE-family HTH domain
MGKKRNGEQLELCARLQSEFGVRLRTERENGGVLQKNLAHGMSLTRASISNIERGQQRVYLDQVYLAARILGVALDRLLPQREDVFDAAFIRSVSDDPLPARVAEKAQQIVERIASSRASKRSSKGARRSQGRAKLHLSKE